MSDEPLRLKRQITLHYRFAAGRYGTPFFRALRAEGRVLATVDDAGNVLLPPRPVSGLTNTATKGWVEVGPTATLSGYTVVHVPFIDPMTGERRPVPYGFGLVRFDGAATNVYHLIDETDRTKLRVGLPLEPVFKPVAERQGNLADIRFFRVREGGEAATARPIPTPEADEPLVYEQKIDLPYVYTAGAAQRAFLRGLAGGRVVASVNDEGRRYVPARSHAPDGRPLSRTEDVAPTGVLEAATTAHHLPGAPSFGLIRIDGSETPLVHRLADGAERLPPGARVVAVFAEPAPEEPSVNALAHFRPGAVTVRGLAHVGILVPDVEPARALFTRLGCAVTGPERDEALGLWLLWVDVGDATLEFVAPARDDSRAAAALGRGEGGVHHVALEVADVEGAIAELTAAGTPVRDAVPRRGAHGSRVSFLDPAAAGGALIELVEP